MSKQLLTIFGATGKQGGSVIDVVLARPELTAKYALRGISRDPESDKSKALSSQGVEVMKGDLDDLESLKVAVRGSHGVYGVTDFWSTLDKKVEIQQGKNIFDASKAEGVKHLVFSGLWSTEKLSNGKYTHIDHFDGKADVSDYIEANKGNMIASHFLPAMFIDVPTSMTSVQNGTPTLAMPWPNENVAIPVLDPRPDGGKWVMGLFEGGNAANGVRVQGISAWTTPKKIVAALSKAVGQEVALYQVPVDEFTKILSGKMGPDVGRELSEMFEFIGEYSYYGKGTEKQQAEDDKWLLKGAKLESFEQWAEKNAPKKYE